MKNVFTFLFLLFSIASLQAQQSLEYNQAIIVGSSVQTVPAGKVWKVTSVYGYDLVCDPSVLSNCNWSSNNTKLHFLSSLVYVNGNKILSTNKLFGYSYQTCGNTISSIANSVLSSCLSDATKSTWPDVEANSNAFPMWLPAGTTVATGGPNTFASVIEFNIIP